MAKIFENLDNILHYWAKDEYKQCIVERGIEQVREEQSSRKNKDKAVNGQTQIGKPRTIALSRI